jgi:hypothetical protein
MAVGFPSIRVDQRNERHHLWCNNGTWWVHYTVHFGYRKRRVRRSLQTRSLTEAVVRRDSLLLRIASEGDLVPERAHERPGEQTSFDRRAFA